MLMRCGRDAPIDEQAVEVFAASLVVADFQLRRNTGSCKVGAEGNLHVQQGIELAAFHLPAKLRIALSASLFVKDNELNTRQVANQLRFDLADHPGDFDTG